MLTSCHATSDPLASHIRIGIPIKPLKHSHPHVPDTHHQQSALVAR
jgi:hypothetical protein